MLIHKMIVLIFFWLSFNVSLIAQQDGAPIWNGRKCAVALTYDDALNAHLDKVIPILDSLGLKGTFYLPGNATALDDRLDEWRAIAVRGHELGNHSLFHPCYGKSLQRDWVDPDFDLDDYTIGRIVGEVKVNNTLLKAIDGKSERTYAYPCGEFMISDVNYIDSIRNNFIAARTTERRFNHLDEPDLMQLGTFSVNGQTGEELIAQVRKARQQNALIIFLATP